MCLNVSLQESGNPRINQEEILFKEKPIRIIK